MDIKQTTIEHPFVTRMKNRSLPFDSPMLTLKDKEQPSQGSLKKKLCFDDYANSLMK